MPKFDYCPACNSMKPIDSKWVPVPFADGRDGTSSICIACSNTGKCCKCGYVPEYKGIKRKIIAEINEKVRKKIRITSIEKEILRQNKAHKLNMPVTVETCHWQLIEHVGLVCPSCIDKHKVSLVNDIMSK